MGAIMMRFMVNKDGIYTAITAVAYAAYLILIIKGV